MSTHANAPLTPEDRRRLWGVGKNAVTSRNRAAVARAKGRLRGKQPKLSAKQQTELRRIHTTGPTWESGSETSRTPKTPPRPKPLLTRANVETVPRCRTDSPNQ